MPRISTKVQKTCATCGEVFYLKPSESDERKNCGRKCQIIFQTQNGNPNWRGGKAARKEKTCLECGVSFLASPYSPGKYCSRLCMNRALAKAKSVKAKESRVEKVIVPKVFISKAKVWRCIECGTVVNRKAKRCQNCLPKKLIVKNVCKQCEKEFEYKACPSTKRKIFCSRSCAGNHKAGANNSNYKGGITPINKRIRASQEYKNWRKSVFERDNYTCIWCGRVGHRLHADHIKPFAFYPESRFDINNGRTLCKQCHSKTDTYLKGKKNMYKETA